jgi:hypothetical protein
MGLFLSMSSIIGGAKPEVEDALRRYAELHEGSLREESLTIDEEGRLAMCEAAGGVTVVYPSDFYAWEHCSQFLSAELGKPVFMFHIHDGDLWMYTLHETGRQVDQFNPVPDYWGDLEEEELRSWQGNPEEVANRVPGISPENIARYLVRWGDEVFESDERTKAYPDDEFYYGDDWQLLDFMKRLQLEFPSEDRGRSFIDTYRFECRPPADF